MCVLIVLNLCEIKYSIMIWNETTLLLWNYCIFVPKLMVGIFVLIFFWFIAKFISYIFTCDCLFHEKNNIDDEDDNSYRYNRNYGNNNKEKKVIFRYQRCLQHFQWIVHVIILYGIRFIGFILFLNIIGINNVALIAGMSLISAAVVYSVGSIVVNAFTGILLKIHPIFFKGDDIEIEGYKSGKVMDITLKYTKIHQKENNGILYIPNNMFNIHCFYVKNNNSKPLSYNNNTKYNNSNNERQIHV